jgi:hypothetical protein
MKTILATILFTALAAQLQLRAAVLLPALNDVRDLIVEELAGLTNAPVLTPEERRQVRMLNQARRNIERAGRPSLFGDIQILSGVSSTLSRAFPDGEFNFALQQSVLAYQAPVLAWAEQLNEAISELPPSSALTSASAAIESVISSVGALTEESTLAEGVQALTRGAVRLRSAEALVARSRSQASRGDRLTARVEGVSFTADSAIGATYNPATRLLVIAGRDLGPLSSSRTIRISLGNVTTGTTTHSLGGTLTDSFATFTLTSPSNTVALTSVSGTAVVTVNAAQRRVTGRFSFEATDPLGRTAPVTVTGGDFFLALP